MGRCFLCPRHPCRFIRQWRKDVLDLFNDLGFARIGHKSPPSKVDKGPGRREEAHWAALVDVAMAQEPGAFGELIGGVGGGGGGAVFANLNVLRPTPCTLHPAPCTLHPAPCTLHLAHCTLHPAPCTLHPTPCTLHLASYTSHPKP